MASGRRRDKAFHLKNLFSSVPLRTPSFLGWGVLFLCSAFLAGCAASRSSPEQTEITVFAAASLTESFQEISRQFQQEHADVKVTLVFAGSQQLARQIAEGAPVDVFASANSKQMETLESAGMVQTGQVRPFASNRLVVVAPAANPAGLKAPADLATPGLRLVLAAAEVPVGQYTLEFLDKASQKSAFGAEYRQAVLANVVSYENDVRAVLNKVALNEADAGIVYHSDITPQVAEKVLALPIPDELNVIAQYPIATLVDSLHPELAQAFVDFVLSTQGQTVLANFGFIPVQP